METRRDIATALPVHGWARPFTRWRPTVMHDGLPRGWRSRLGLHLALASAPILGISADVFGWLSLKTLGIDLLVPLLCVLALLLARHAHRSDLHLLSGFGWGLV